VKWKDGSLTPSNLPVSTSTYTYSPIQLCSQPLIFSASSYWNFSLFAEIRIAV
jgi:hypothetical protein